MSTSGGSGGGVAPGSSTAGTAGNVFIGSKVTADANDRLDWTYDGQLLWGPGTTATDTRLRRTAANALTLDNGGTGPAQLSFGGTSSATISGGGGAAFKIQAADLSGIQMSGGLPAQFLNTSSAGVASVDGTGRMSANGGFVTNAITAGSLPTATFVSGTGRQLSTTRDVELHVPVTLTTAAGTCAVALSPDNVTYSTLVTLTPGVAAAVVDASLTVPAGWYVKLTVTNATLGTGTYY